MRQQNYVRNQRLWHLQKATQTAISAMPTFNSINSNYDGDGSWTERRQKKLSHSRKLKIRVEGWFLREGEGRVCAYLQFIAFYYALCCFLWCRHQKGNLLNPFDPASSRASSLMRFFVMQILSIKDVNGYEKRLWRHHSDAERKIEFRKVFWFFLRPRKFLLISQLRENQQEKLAASQSRNIFFFSCVWTDDPNSWFPIHLFRCWPILNFMPLWC